MAILKKEYEISVWDEALAENGQKTEKKKAIIGAHDMDYPGRATSIKFSKKLNGTSTLTFQMPSRFFDSKVGDYVHNELCDNIFNERKIKLKYDGKWYEYYVKDISETKQFKSIMYQYTCQDAFIDELSRNGYGITFDAELYNNVEEIGVFTNEILKDSIWYYDAKHNWGDFTEYAEEKLFKIPVSQFNSLKGYKLNYKVDGEIENAFSKETRVQEMGDDKSREENLFWDGQTEKGIMYPLLNSKCELIDNDGYIYVPYSQLSFCYVPIPKKDSDQLYAATETARVIEINTNGRKIQSYALAPASIDPTSLIQFIAIPRNAEVLIDEAGLLVNKEYSYVMTLAQWNKTVNTNAWYHIEEKVLGGVKEIDPPEGTSSTDFEPDINAHDANKVVCYDGYLESINDVDMVLGKKISVTDRTEMNISEEVDSFVKVYNNHSQEYSDYYTNENWKETTDNYRVCSFEATRVIAPQLARNLVQNGTNIADASGWQIMASPADIKSNSSEMIAVTKKQTVAETEKQLEDSTSCGALMLKPCASSEKTNNRNYYTFLNFGIIGQKETISQNQVYLFYLARMTKADLANDKDTGEFEELTSCDIIIGDGRIGLSGDYEFIDEDECMIIHWNDNLGHVFIKPKRDYKNPYFAIRLQADQKAAFFLKEVIFCKAYTKGIDFFESGRYKYTGRDIMFNKDKNVWFSSADYWTRAARDGEYLLETDVVNGDVYGYQRYFIQQINTRDGKNTKDTFKMKSYLNNDYEKFALDPAEYTEEDYEIETNYIDLNKCNYYNSQSPKDTADCTHPKSNGLCMYQKYGYCPYLFQTEKHCRKIRTLNGEKSNRFNLTQELSKVFEIYPIYYTEHFGNGKIQTEEKIIDGKKQDVMMKKVFYITEKGMENKIGFRYEKNLSNISRTLNSNEIVTKLYVEDVDSDLSKTGLCSIKTAEDNPTRDNFIIDFSYYTMRGLLNKEATDYDLYGKDHKDMGYLKKIGYYNKEYDELSNKIIAFQDESYTELEGNIQVNLEGISTAQQQINQTKKKLSQYTKGTNDSKEESDTYKNYKAQLDEQENILYGLIESTFFSEGSGYCYVKDKETNQWKQYTERTITKASDFLKAINGGVTDGKWVGDFSSFEEFKQEYLDKFDYVGKGMMGQYMAEYNQIKTWKKKRANILKKINEISLKFFKKYEPFLKEGTWSDSNYLSDNAYYFGAKEVAKQGAIPKLNYNISVIDLAARGKDDAVYKVDIADTTYIEDIETFGINKKTGFPNRLKVIVSGITYDLDNPTQNSIEIQNYTTQFEDLFEQVSASVQSLTFNENIYKRSSNFTATKNVEGESLQGALDENQITLLSTEEDNLHLDQNGQSGSDMNNHNNKYKLDGQGLFFSNNGGQTWNVGVTPKGINADYIKVGSLDASRVAIVDGSYLYFLWDKSGITAYRTPQATTEGEPLLEDFARFNKYGLSLVENGQIKLRAGYGYLAKTNDANGKINEEDEISENSKIGFYLYNDKGNVIFKAENAKNAYQSAQIALKGEIYTSDTINYTEGIYKNLNYQYNDAYSFNKKNIKRLIKKDSYIGNTINQEVSKQDFINRAFANAYRSNEIQLGEETTEITYFNIKIQCTITVKQIGIEDIYDATDKKHYRINKANINFKTSSEQTKEIQESEQNRRNAIYEILNINEKVDVCFTGENSITIYVLQNLGEYIYYNATHKEKDSTKTSQALTKKSILYFKNEPAKSTNETELYKKAQEIKTSTLNLYFDDKNNIGYVKQSDYNADDDTTVKTEQGTTELYINNKVLLNEGEEAGRTINSQENHRLFSCIRRVGSEKNNIFTIKKDGSLYFGGTITDTDEAGADYKIEDDTLKPCVTIANEGIRITNSGELSMDLSLFTDIKTGTPLMDIIADAVNSVGVGSHTHKIEKINLKTENCALYGPANSSEAAALGVILGTTLGLTGNEKKISADMTSLSTAFVQFIHLLLGREIRFDPPGSSSSEIKYQWTGRIPAGKEDNNLVTLNCVDTMTSTYSDNSTWSYGNTGNATSYKDWYWCGDSRTVGLISATGVAGEGTVGGGAEQLKELINNGLLKRAENKNLVLWWGVNDRNAAAYKGTEGSEGPYEKIIKNFKGKVIILSVTPVLNTSNGISDEKRTIGEEGGSGNTSLNDFNSYIDNFNNDIKQKFSDVTFLDASTYFEDLKKRFSVSSLAAGEGNGLHYSTTCYQEIKKWVEEQISYVDPGEPSHGEDDVLKIYNALIDAKYDKYAALGIIGNMYQESTYISYNLQTLDNPTEEDLKKLKSFDDFKALCGNSEKIGFGLVQFTSNDKKEDLWNCAQELGVLVWSIKAQVMAVARNSAGSPDAMNGQATVADAVKLFMNKYEIPDPDYANLQGRIDAALAVESKYNL